MDDFKMIPLEKGMLAIDGLELLEEEAMLVLGGNVPPPPGSGSGCGCACSSGSGCGCGCANGSGCGCGCN